MGDARAADAEGALRHVRRDVAGMAGYTPGEQVADCIKLNTNEPSSPPSPAVLAAVAAIPPERFRLYPDPRATALRRAAAGLYGVDESCILAGNGSADCLTVLYRSLCGPGDRVACPWPTYGLYDTLAALQGVAIQHLDYRQHGGGWDLPEGLEGCGAKLVMVANPNNPSATLTAPDRLRRLAERLDGILCVDEAYVDFAPPGSSLLPFLAEHPNLVVLRTFSKSYSLAGARLGLMFAGPALTDVFMKVKDSYNVNHLTQVAGAAALRDRAHHAQLVAAVLAERRRLEAALAGMGWSWPASAANFLLCQVGPQAGRIYEGLKQRGILVRWWNRPGLSERLRITVGAPAQNDALLAALKALA